MKVFRLARTFGGVSVNSYLTFLDALTFGFRETWSTCVTVLVNDAPTIRSK